MKKVLAFAALVLSVMACNLDGYTEYTGSSVANFEFSEKLGENKYDVSMYTDSVYLTSVVGGGSNSLYVAFNSQRPSDGADLTGGFALSVKRDSSLVIASDNPYPQYTMFAKSAAMDSYGCAVFYQNDDDSLMPEHDVVFSDGGAQEWVFTPSYCMINNTQLTVYSVLSDDSPLKFEPGDYLKLKITGISEAGATTGSVEYYLADYRNSIEKPDSVLTSWKTISLTKLGDVKYVDFSLETNKEGFPTYVCVDNFVNSYDLKF